MPTSAAEPAWSQPQLRVLRVLLNADQPLWALDVARAIGVPYGTVYGTFRRLYDLGWSVGITEQSPPGRPARVLYRPTTSGRIELARLLGECST